MVEEQLIIGAWKLLTTKGCEIKDVSHPGSMTVRVTNLFPGTAQLTLKGPIPLPVTLVGLSKSHITSALTLAVPVKVITIVESAQISGSYVNAATGAGLISTIKQVGGPSPHSLVA